MVSPELRGTAAPGGWARAGPEVGGTGSSERMSTYLASSRVPELYPTVVTFWGQGTGSREPSGRLAGHVRGGHGRHVWFSHTPPTCVSESCLLAALDAHLFLVHPLNGMFHLPWEPRGRNSLFEKVCVCRAGSLGAPIRCHCPCQVEGTGQGQPRRRTLAGQGRQEVVPTPPSLGTVRAGDWKGTDTCCLCGSRQMPPQVVEGQPNKLG